jgi:hypothetical protein
MVSPKEYGVSKGVGRAERRQIIGGAGASGHSALLDRMILIVTTGHQEVRRSVLDFLHGGFVDLDFVLASYNLLDPGTKGVMILGAVLQPFESESLAGHGYKFATRGELHLAVELLQAFKIGANSLDVLLDRMYVFPEGLVHFGPQSSTKSRLDPRLEEFESLSGLDKCQTVDSLYFFLEKALCSSLHCAYLVSGSTTHGARK